MAFEPHQLDDIRARIKVSDVVGKRFQLVKRGSEYVAKDNESFTVNDKKRFWVEFGDGGDGKPHDIFAFLQEYEGYEFPAAVEELAQQAGVTLTNGDGRSSVSSNRSGNAPASGARPFAGGSDGSSDAAGHRPNEGVGGAGETESRGDPRDSAAGKNEVVAAWDYLDPENQLLYQVVRMQARMPDGSFKVKNGKVWKTFMQRRPAGDGSWILGLDVLDRDSGEPLEFIKTATGTAWLRATDERREWKNTTIRTFAELGNVDHWLYNANAVIDELQEPKEDQRTIFIPEGEAKVDVLKDWGLLAVTNSSGAKHFSSACAEFFRNARHVVILQDNDRAGAERVAKIAPMLQAVGVELVQALNFRDVWPACPMKGDVKDWRDVGGGTKDQLLEIVDDLKSWVATPYKSIYGAMTAADLSAPAKAYPWRIKNILPMHENALFMGPSRSGKTFEVLDMLMHIHSGETFAGHRVIPAGSIYLNYEGATGFMNRVRAYMIHHGMKADSLHSFSWLTRPPNLYANEDNPKKLAGEIIKIAEKFVLPLGHIVVDTNNAAMRGSSEIKSEDINRVLDNYQTVSQITGVPLIIIGHTNAEGKHRGSELIFNNIDTAVLVERVYTDPKKTIEKRDDEGRAIRRGVMVKQRDGDDRVRWEFVLQSVKIGVDEDGEDITSMVSIEPAQHVPDNAVNEIRRDRPQGFYLNDTQVSQFKALLDAINELGIPPPPALKLPTSVGRVITTTQLGTEWRRGIERGEDEAYAKYMARTKASLRRFIEKLSNSNIIGVDAVDISTPEEKKAIHYVWPTGNRVVGRGLQWPAAAPKKKEQPKPITAPGESESDIPMDLT